MTINEEAPIIKKEGNKFIIYNIPKKCINNGSKLIVRLKENYLEYEYLHREMLTIESDVYTLAVTNFGYYECEIFDCYNRLVFEEHETILGKVLLNLDFKTSEGIIRHSLELQEKEFKENTMVLINKMEKIYFEIPELQDRIEEILNEIITGVNGFVYIQDPYFDYNFYKQLIENLPKNLDVKVLYSPQKIDKLHLPSNYTFTLIEDNGQNGQIHDRFIITKDFGYYIGISLIVNSKSRIHRITEISLLVSIDNK